MIAWWESIDLVEQLFVIIAAPSTLILIIQIIMLVFGGGLEADGSGSMDAPDMVDADTDGMDGGFRLFTVSGILSFLTVFGWGGVLLMEMNANAVMAGTISAVLGAGALVGMAYMIRGLMGLAETGNINYRKALGKTARVYLTIPPAGQGQGKINMMLGETLGEFSAVTENSEPIPTGAAVRVIDLAGTVYTVE